MPRSKLYVGLEIGTSKTCAVVGELRPDSGIRILGVGQVPSRGVRKGEIIDFERAQGCLHDALIKAEERCGQAIKKVYLSISGAHIESTNNRGSIRVSNGKEVTDRDVAEVQELARDFELPQSHAPLHSMVRSYHLDGQDVSQSPLGLAGQVLEADYHIIHGIRTRIQNTIRCVRELPMEVEDIVFAPLASAQVVLNRSQRDQGALVLDIGGGTTDYVLYHKGAVVASGCLGVGGDHITNDISMVLRVPMKVAEKLKTQYGSVFFDSRKDGNVMVIENGSEAPIEVDENMLNQIIHLRVREMLELVARRLEPAGLLKLAGAGLFLTGGSSLLEGLGDLAQAIFKLPVQRDSGLGQTGARANFDNPQYSTPIGLVRFGQLMDSQAAKRGPASGLSGKIGGWLGGVAR